MPKKQPPPDFRAVIDRFSEELTEAIAGEVERRVAEAVAGVRTELGAGRIDGRRGGRLCPVPGCGKAGAGPRNRWFCKDHAGKLSVAEQKGILERNKRLAAEGKLPTAVSSDRIVRLPPKTRRTRRALDMTCRVDNCHNRSRGPRAGFICDAHRAQLSPEEQRAAREAYKHRQRDGLEPEAPPSSRQAAPVPPIVRKAEATEG